MAVGTVREFVVALENTRGSLAQVASGLGSAGVNITGFTLQGQGDFAVLRLTVSDPVKCEAWLVDSGLLWRMRESVAAPSVNRLGELGRLSAKLAASGVNVEAAYRMFPTETESHVLFAVDNVAAAKKALAA